MFQFLSRVTSFFQVIQNLMASGENDNILVLQGRCQMIAGDLDSGLVRYMSCISSSNLYYFILFELLSKIQRYRYKFFYLNFFNNDTQYT